MNLHRRPRQKVPVLRLLVALVVLAATFTYSWYEEWILADSQAPQGRQVNLLPPVDPLPEFFPKETPSEQARKSRRDRPDPGTHQDVPARPQPKPALTWKPNTPAASPTKPAPRASEKWKPSPTPSPTSPEPTPTSSPSSPGSSEPRVNGGYRDPSPTIASPDSARPSAPVPPVVPSPRTTLWYPSVAAVIAARRMAMADVVGDPSCSLASSGEPVLDLVPDGVDRIGIGRVGNYTCLIY